MNTIFKYNGSAKYSTKDLKGGYNSNNFSLLDVYVDEKGPSVKIQLSNIFKDHQIVAKQSPTTVSCDEWPLSIALWRKFYNSHGKYKPDLKEYFHMYWCQLNFAMFCVTSAFGISWQHLNHPNLLVCAVYRFHVCLHIRFILHDLGVSLPHDDGFTVFVMTMVLMQMKQWMHWDRFYRTDYGIFGHEVKATERSSTENITR